MANKMVWQCRGGLVTIAALEFGKVVQFYAQFLNLVPQPHIPNNYAEFHLPSLRLGIFKPNKEQSSEFANKTQSSLSLCLEVNDLAAAIAHLTSLGYPPPGEIIDTDHGREIYAFDPAGNRLILVNK